MPLTLPLRPRPPVPHPDTLPLRPSIEHRRRVFAEAYAVDPCSRRAARLAGYAEGGGTPARLLRHPDVVEYIAEARRAAAEAVGLRGRAAIEKARADAVLSLASYWTLEHLPPELPGENVRALLRLKRLDELTYAEVSALSAESFDTGGRLVAIVLRDPTAALVELGRRAALPGFEEEVGPTE